MKYKNIIGISIIIGAVVAGLGILYITGNLSLVSESVDTLDDYAKQMVKKCADAPYRPTCYEVEVPKLASKLTSTEVFDVVRQIRKYDPEYLSCHVLAHQLGEYEMSVDPENWLDVIAKAPQDGLCSNGFIHGAALSRFNNEVLTPEEIQSTIPDFKIACEERDGWRPTNLQKAMCYHGVGHVLAHLTEADVSQSIDICEQIGLKDDGRDYQELCVGGLYMQLFQPLEPEDFALIDQLPVAPTRENIAEFCANNSNNESQYGLCWSEAWPFFFDEIFTADGVTNYCSALSDSRGREECYIGAFTINGRQHLGQPEKMASLCNSVSEEYQGMCFARGANAFPEEDPQFIPEGIDMCSRADSQQAKDECYSFLASVASFNFHPDSEPFEQLCSSLPERWQKQCWETGR